MNNRSREEEIIQYLLSLRDILRYKLIEFCTEGKWLPGGVNHRELSSHSAIVVTPEETYFIWLAWDNGEDGYYSIDRYIDGLVPMNLEEEADEELQQKIRRIQQEMKEDPQVGVYELNLPEREPGKATRREEKIIYYRLRHYEFQDNYALVDVQSGGQDLVGSLYPGEVQDITALLVMPYEVCRLTLDWNWEQRFYTFGEEKGAFRLVQRAECTQEVWDRVEEVQRPLREKVERETQEQWAEYEREYWELQEEAPDKEVEELFWKGVGGTPIEKASRSVLDIPRWEQEERRKRQEDTRLANEQRAREEVIRQGPPPPRVRRNLDTPPPGPKS